MNRSGRVGLAVRAAVLVLFAVFFAAPLLWLVLAPTKTDYQLATEWPFAFGSFNNVVRTWHQLDGFSDHLFRQWMENSLVYSFSATALVLLTAIPGGYGLAFGRFRGRRLVLAVTMVAMTLPVTALVLPVFLELNALHLLGSALTAVLPLAFFPFGTFLSYLYYATAVPPALLDAARVDGCGEWATFWRVALPLAKPIVALVFFFSFAADWTNFFLPYAVLPESSQISGRGRRDRHVCRRVEAAARTRSADCHAPAGDRLRIFAALPDSRAGQRCRDRTVSADCPDRSRVRSVDI